MKHAIIALCLGCILAGCAAQRQRAAMDKAVQSADATIADCKSQFASGALTSHEAVVQCYAPGVHAAFAANPGYPFLDLIDLDLANRKVIAEQWDAGAITEAQAEQMAAQSNSQMVAEMHRREAETVATRAQAVNANANALAAGAALGAAFRPVQTPAPIIQRPLIAPAQHCTTLALPVGNVVNYQTNCY